MNKISVIIPVYNSEAYIDACIASLLEQTYSNFEVIIIDDGSNLDCQNKLQEIDKLDERILLYKQEVHKGVGAARNYGIEKASGEFIYFLDSDDYISETTLELLVTNIGNHPIIRGRMHTTDLSNSFALIFDGVYKVSYFEDNKFNLINKSGVHNFLIRSSYIEQNQLRFSEEVKVYSDLPFIVSALNNIEKIPYMKEAIYFYRRRNAPIKSPSLNQLDVGEKIYDFLYIYLLLKKNYNNPLAQTYLDNQFLNFYRKDVVSLIQKSNELNTYFDQLSEAAKQVKESHLNTYDFIFKREIKTLAKGDIRKYKKLSSRLTLLRDLNKGLKSRSKMRLFVYKYIFKRLKTKEEWVFFESFQGKSYSDNPKYIYQYLNNENLNYKYIWSMDERSNDIPFKHTQVKRLSLKYYYYLARSKYWILNSRLPNYIDKFDDNVYLQTWHGTPLKRLAGDMEQVHMPKTTSEKYKKNFYNETQKWDYLVSPNNYSTEIFKSAFWFNKTFLNEGYPRNDILYNKNNNKDIEKLKDKIGVPKGKKIILYAPTWRDNEFYAKGKYKFNLQLDLDKLQKELGEDYIIILRMHYLVATQMDISEFEGFAYDMSFYNDIGELYLISDLLITDYSSVFFDYANLKRPILFYTYDIDMYRNALRGFYINMEEEVPGPMLQTTNEIIDTIHNIEEISEKYSQKYRLFYDKFCKWDDGQASKRIVERVLK